jgi:hypothetical protein
MAVEAAGRAYVVAVSLALLANLASFIGSIPPIIWRRIRDRRERPASMAEVDP